MGQSINSLLILGALLAGSVVATPTQAQEGEAGPAKVQSFRAGLVLLDGEAAYAVNPSGGIDALDLQTGKLRWSTAPAKGKDEPGGPNVLAQAGCYWPLAVDGRVLVVRERHPDRQKWKLARLVFLDLSQKGKVVKRFEPAEFPVAWWNDPVFQSIGGAAPRPLPPPPVFRSETHIESGRLLLAWESGSALPAAKQETKRGVIEVDLKSGQVRALPSEKKLTEPTEIVLGERRFTVTDATTLSKGGPGISSTSTFPILQAIDTQTGKSAWQHTLRGGSTVTVNYLAPARPPR
jgi:hypothetical protein